MTISIWRYSHLALAVSSFILLILASVTGIILAFEPVVEKTKPYHIHDIDQISLAQTLPVLDQKYPDIIELSVDVNQFVMIKGMDADGNNIQAYIDPRSGEILGYPEPKSRFFQWVTNLHRSLFLKETGRFIIGLTSFLLLLITISGTILIIQRQRGLKRFFFRIVKDSFAQYYHVVLGRWSLIPVFVIALSGTYLFLIRFEMLSVENVSLQIDFDAIREEPVQAPADFGIFKSTVLSDLQVLEFPFSEFPDDYYILKLTDREVAVNQFTGDILDEVYYPTAQTLNTLSLDLHTGRTSIIWALILAVASGNILFFIYSGFAITLKRRANQTKNKYTADESRFIILVGSENGSTFRFAQTVHEQLIQQGEKSYLTELNDYKTFPKAAYLIVMTATYGLGDAPTNARKLGALLERYPQPNPVHYAVVGFGSKAYADYCKFAFEVNNLLAQQKWGKAMVDVHTVNDKSPEDFGLWTEALSQQTGIPISVMPQLRQIQPKRLNSFTVTTNTASAHTDATFLIRFQPKRKIKYTSGDLLAIYPANDHRERLYSIGKVDKELQLSVRLHEGGLGSGFLHSLRRGEVIRAKVLPNEHFHFPKKAAAVIMISNGTGIGPYLGMISHNKRKTPSYLYCGFRDRSTFKMYEDFLEESKAAGKLGQLAVAFSREGEKQYVSDLIERDAAIMASTLKNKGVIMICGSLAMQKDVLDLLENICLTETGKGVSYYQSRSQILMDCY